jgi:hypothetical protein
MVSIRGPERARKRQAGSLCPKDGAHQRAGSIEVLSQGMERDQATAAELGLSQTAAAEIVEEGVPA